MKKCKQHKHCRDIGPFSLLLLIACAFHYLGFWSVIVIVAIGLFVLSFLHDLKVF